MTRKELEERSKKDRTDHAHALNALQRAVDQNQGIAAAREAEQLAFERARMSLRAAKLGRK